MKIFKKILNHLFVLYKTPILYKMNNSKISIFTRLNNNTIIGKQCVIYKGVRIRNSQIGDATYISINCFLDNAIIGKYCCLASNIRVIAATHPTRKFVSIHPAFFSLSKQSGFTYVKKQLFNEHLYVRDTKTSVIIGNDVWIGYDVKIIGGVEIGDGAIIATGSVVTKNIPPYAIVGGIPANIIRYRFTEEQIRFLNDFKWWNRSAHWIQQNAHYFSDINTFILENNQSLEESVKS
jgi:acetyltransferase-like isoleucine patch superfamily enzyme